VICAFPQYSEWSPSLQVNLPVRDSGAKEERVLGFWRGSDRRWTASVDSPRSRRRVITIKASSRLHGENRHARFATTAPRRSVRRGFLRSNPRIEAVILRWWQRGLIAAGTAPPSPRCVDSTVPGTTPGSSTPFANTAAVSGVSMASVGVPLMTFLQFDFVQQSEHTC
jgi:hypothetical protein